MGTLFSFLRRRGGARRAHALLEQLKSNPANALLRLRAAEQCARAGDRQRAAALYMETARQFAAQGHFARAIAAANLAVRSAPEDPKIRQTLESLRRREGSLRPA